VIDEPAGGEMGGVVAAPAFRKIIQQIITHPELEYAGKFIKKDMKPVEHNDSIGKMQMPLICGKDRQTVITLLTDIPVKYRIEGTGTIVVNQFPKAGTLISSGDTVSIYCENNITATDSKSVIPDFTGMDLRDAINIMGAEGLKPFAVGAGIVKQQKPISGSLIRSTEVCTLYCSFDG
jgi:hypothetical protein